MTAGSLGAGASPRLSRSGLAQLPPEVGRPAYDLARVKPGIVHLGLGGFHRAHMARYTHELMNLRRDALDWGIVGASLLPADRRMSQALGPQDGLYTLLEREDGEERATVIGSLAEVVYGGETTAPLLDAIASSQIRIVSLTVTGAGYMLDAATRRIDLSHPAAQADLLGEGLPRSAIGVLVEGFRRCRDARHDAFTALSCDNIQNNGAVLRDAVVAFAAARDPELGRWIAGEARFPSTMVDRITPATTPEDVAHVAARYGVQDAWPVVSEAFSQWVIEDDFPTGRPAWHEVGAQFVGDVAPYEMMKLRLLNASHLAVAGLGRLMGHRHIDEALRDDRIRRYMQALMVRETGPTLPPVLGVDLGAYQARLLDRFANASIKDTTDRVNADAPVALLVEPIQDRLGAGRSVELLALALAAWLRRVRGIDEAGRPLEVSHPLAAQLRERARAGGPDPRPLLALTSLFGDLGSHEGFVSAVARWLKELDADGASTTLDRAADRLSF